MDIIDEMVDLARLAYKADKLQADELVSKIVARTSDFKLGRVLSMEQARLRCTEKTNIDDLEAEVEFLQKVLEDVDDVKVTAIGLLDPDLHEQITAPIHDTKFNK